MSFDEHQKVQIRKVLQLVLDSPGLSNSPQLQSFLGYAVEKTLDGKQRELKGYSIGVDALGKSEDFDPSTDPSVRVTAGRLRQALATFFLENPDLQGPVISLPKGSYVPRFEWREPPASELAEVTQERVFPAGPSNFQSRTSALALLIAGTALVLSLLSLYLFYSNQEDRINLPQPVALNQDNSQLPTVLLSIEFDENGLPDWQSPQLMASRAVVAFSRFNEYRVVRTDSDGADDQGFDYKLKLYASKANNQEDLYLVTSVSRGSDNEVIWSGSNIFTRPLDNRDIDNREQVGKLVSEIMSPYGIIYGDIVSREAPPPRLDCIRNIYEYFSTERLQAYSTGLECARVATQSGTASSSMHAMLALLYVEAYRRQFSDVVRNPLKEARSQTTKAIELDQANARAYQARFAVEKVSANADGALAAANMAIERNPFDRDIIGDFAAYLISIGEFATASEPLKRALELTPRPPAWLKFHEYLFADLTGDFDQADAIAANVQPNSPLLAATVILASDRIGDLSRLETAIAYLQEYEPGLIKDPKQAFARRGFSAGIAEGLESRILRTVGNAAGLSN